MATPHAINPDAFTDPDAPPGARPPAPLAAVLAFTFLGSMGTGAITNGFSFVASEGLGYGRRLNLLLALVLGITYIIGALLSGKLVARLSRASSPLDPRALLAIVMTIIGLVCQLPILVRTLAPEHLEASIWVLIAVFSPASGVLWPLVEAYLSGGRSGAGLRSAIGRFNITWSSALVLSFWMMAPLLEHHPFLILSLLGFSQLAVCAVLIWFPRHPAAHAHASDDARDTQNDCTTRHDGGAETDYAKLLTLFRVLLIASYIVLSALAPLLPIVEARLGVAIAWKTPIASAWLTSRVALFFLFERWHGWHGRWWTPWTGMALMLLGFSACMGSPAVAHLAPPLGLPSLILGLIVMGFGIAITYSGALYYAMSTPHIPRISPAPHARHRSRSAHHQVEAGGKHEAVIGMGYTLGPLCGLAGFAISEGNDDVFRLWVILLVSAAVVFCTLLGIVLIRRTDGTDPLHPPFDPPSPH